MRKLSPVKLASASLLCCMSHQSQSNQARHQGICQQMSRKQDLVKTVYLGKISGTIWLSYRSSTSMPYRASSAVVTEAWKKGLIHSLRLTANNRHRCGEAKCESPYQHDFDGDWLLLFIPFSVSLFPPAAMPTKRSKHVIVRDGMGSTGCWPSRSEERWLGSEEQAFQV